jgi:hypothetical protein
MRERRVDAQPFTAISLSIKSINLGSLKRAID